MPVAQRKRIWQGQGASPGVVVGRARVIRTDGDLAEVSPDEVLVSRHATPAFLPALLQASGAVCQTGGVLNHLAILARELGKPCVTSCPGIVDVVQQGSLIRIDGANGSVQEIACRPSGIPAIETPPVAPDLSEMVPLLRFGRFTASFEAVDAVFELDAAVRTAALVTLPLSLGAGERLGIRIDDGRVLVARRTYEELVELLVTRVENDTLRPAEMRGWYDERCCWDGWRRIGQPPAPGRLIRQALADYVVLNQLTWASAAMQGPLLKRYEAFLGQRLTELLEGQRRRLFLDSLARPGLSYIVNSWADSQTREHAWSASVGDDERQHFLRRAPTLLRESAARHFAAHEELRRHLRPEDGRKVDRYLTALTELAILTERKNTDLFRCTGALFADREPLAKAIGLSPRDLVDQGTGIERMALVDSIVRTIGVGPQVAWAGAFTGSGDSNQELRA